MNQLQLTEEELQFCWIFTELGNNNKEITLEWVMDEIKKKPSLKQFKEYMVKNTIISLWRKLSNDNYGRFMIGRRGSRTRFIIDWNKMSHLIKDWKESNRVEQVEISEVVKDLANPVSSQPSNSRLPDGNTQQIGEITKFLSETNSDQHPDSKLMGIKTSRLNFKDENLICFSFPLRPDTRILIELPKDLTAEERDRLATLIKLFPVADNYSNKN